VIRAVIDNNVPFSGLLSPAGNEALIVLAIHQGFIGRACRIEWLNRAEAPAKSAYQPYAT
jgi:hypothetical protein